MASARPTKEMPAQYDALTTKAGFHRFAARTQLELCGKDRVGLLHGLCTNDIRKLQPGEGCEAFLTDARGRTLSRVNVFCGSDSLFLDTDGDQSHFLTQHFDRYIIREDVTIVDHSRQWASYLLGGNPGAMDGLIPGALPSSVYSHRWLDSDFGWLAVRRVPWLCTPSYIAVMNQDAAGPWEARWEQRGAVRCGEQVVDTVRIEAGTPLVGREITDDHFPQELDRDALAVSFTKGCYLGQETVARLDARGSVQWLLRRVGFRGEHLPAPSREFSLDGRLVMKITSSCWSPRRQCPLALAYVRREYSEPGTRIATEVGEAVVLDRDGV